MCTKFSQNRIVKEFCKSVNICRSYDQNSSVLFFLTHSVYYGRAADSNQSRTVECEIIQTNDSMLKGVPSDKSLPSLLLCYTTAIYNINLPHAVTLGASYDGGTASAVVKRVM